MIQSAETWTKQENRVVCLVDWRGLAVGMYGKTATVHTKIVGSYIVELIQSQNFSADQVVLVGHSLGAHICGFCGKALNGSVKTIYGRNLIHVIFSVFFSNRKMYFSLGLMLFIYFSF